MLRKFLTTLLFSCFAITGHSQNTDTVLHSWTNKTYKKDFSILTGYNQGKYGFADIGLAINHYGTNRHPFSLDYFISNEIKLDKDLIIGPKIGVWLAGGFAMGLNLIYYTDFDKNSLVFRPEVGIGIDKAKLVYGYNWHWTNSLTNINQHQIGLTYCFTLKRLKNIEK
jgi:hypothetical protein